MDKLTYKDCKELKDAGFSAKSGNPYYTCEECKDYVARHCPNCVDIPTLSELIEACGEKMTLDKLSPTDRSAKSVSQGALGLGGYEASFGDGIEDYNYMWFWGKIPEQAVKNLYIALNKNKDEKK